MGSRYINRELSWLEFNHRVLEEVSDRQNPLFERLNFASIVCSNLDEFFMVRVASVQDQIDAGLRTKDPSGLTPMELMEKISLRTHRMMKELYLRHNDELLKELDDEKIRILSHDQLSADQVSFLDDYFEKDIFPVLTPMVADQGRPFPLVQNKSLNIAVLLSDEEERGDAAYFATVQVPSVLGRVLPVPSGDGYRNFILLEEVIRMRLDRLFTGYAVLKTAIWRITRNADLGIHEEGAEDLLEVIEESVRMRRWGAVIRLEIEENADRKILKRLMDETEVNREHVYKIPGTVDLIYLRRIYSLKGYSKLRYPGLEPVIPEALKGREDMFDVIRNKDIFLHHPYNSFLPVVEFVQKAAQDPRVLAIKQTLYRVSEDSPIVKALEQAAENGKQVTVMVEIKARFDEQNNILWAKRLETAGCHVIYGFAGLKTHCKVLLVVRKEEDHIRRYVHLGTGNYNDVTARFYTDMGLFTSNPNFGMDASNLFNMLSGLSKPMAMNRLSVAPYTLREKMLKLINREKENAKRGKKAAIIAKMNSLVDIGIIEALYSASQAGVTISLLVRGICCLRAGVDGMSENITVQSIVGRFLEHSRIYYFYNDGKEEIYLSSADMMQRNLDRRVEVLFPVDDPEIRNQIKGILEIFFRDTGKVRKMTAKGTYRKHTQGQQGRFVSQEYFSGNVEKK
ncbi:RNA degradosome polyphosphate kinase [Parasporobacterium paucivorans]|uniref:Polyphosphate kinase n=1 Tax=Parasporobacterium paucivorans DSM 15970 TaxID=1122934 RepID=A0A1M6JFG1_9FIRM|nr:RNA degradosome polyphosphate kinase [Parasporobacterium paucivorans]SHJ45352.1 polyphosphate kinase [Parasporobacterium paucivorans DSM 15970]